MRTPLFCHYTRRYLRGIDMDGVDILLARIKSHPEDFTDVTRSRTWINLYDHAMSGDLLKADEILALQQAMKDARREMFTQRVLRVLSGNSVRDLDDEEQMHVAYTKHLANAIGNTKLCFFIMMIVSFIRHQKRASMPTPIARGLSPGARNADEVPRLLLFSGDCPRLILA